jgi:hypothetical protein
VSVRDGLINSLGLESPAPMPEKNFRLRTGPEEKMDAFGGEATEIPRVCKKLSPDDDAGDPLQFELDYSMFVISKTLKAFSTLVYMLLSFFKVNLTFI